MKVMQRIPMGEGLFRKTLLQATPHPVSFAETPSCPLPQGERVNGSKPATWVTE